MSSSASNNRPSGAPVGLPVGAKIGKYQVVEILGAGGESIVYKGHDPFLDRFVAIKQVPPQLCADENLMSQFREIIKQLAKLNCEEVVTLYELVEQDGGLFMVMEYVQGHSIEASLATQPGPTEPKAVLQILWRIAGGLAMIHKAGIVHRDLKPANLIVCDGLRVKITDFGVAARMGAAISMRLGTTKYMAPELFSGDHPADARADIYSLGMIAYELLLGREKFNEVFNDVVRDKHSEALRWMKWHSTMELQAPPLAQVNPDVPAPLSAIVAKMLAKDPRKRYANVEELGKDIKASFSPRAQRPAADAPAHSRRHHARSGTLSATATAPAVATDLQGAPPELPPEADTAVDLEGPATAAIPRKPMSLTRKLLLIGAAVAVLVVALVVHVTMRNDQNKKLSIDAMKTWSVAEEDYRKAPNSSRIADRKALYDSARLKFDEIANNRTYTGMDIVRQATVRSEMAQAYIDTFNGNFGVAPDHRDKAQGIIAELLRSNSAATREWAAKADKEIEGERGVGGFNGLFNNQRQYVKDLAEGRKAMEAIDPDTAQTYLNAAGKNAEGEQVDEIKRLLAEVQERKKQGEFNDQMKQGDMLAKKNNVDQAKAAYAKALQILEASKVDMQPSLYEKLKVEAQGKIETLDRENKYALAVREADDAIKKGNRLGAADAYQRAIDIDPAQGAQYKDKIVDLRHDHFLDRARQDILAGKLVEANEELLQAQKYKNSAAVTDELGAIAKIKDYRSMVALADQSFHGKNYDTALQKYQDADKIAQGKNLQGRVDASDLKAKMTDCQYAIKLAAAEKARADKKWDEAKNLYQSAKSIKPAQAAEIDARIDTLNVDRAYEENMAAAEAALTAKKFDDARNKVVLARKAKNTPETKQLEDKIYYQMYLTAGKESLDHGDFNVAFANFSQAKARMNTPEIQDLIKKAQDGIAKTPKP